MEISIRAKNINNWYAVWYNNSNLGDICFVPFFDDEGIGTSSEPQVCEIRFYGWSAGIPLEDLKQILSEVEIFAEEILKDK